MKTQHSQDSTNTKTISIESLPKRPKPSTAVKCQDVTLISNCYKVKVDMTTKIYCYHLDIHTPIMADNKKERLRILYYGDKQIKSRIGNYASSGQNLYGIAPPNLEGGVSEPNGFEKTKKPVTKDFVWLKLDKEDTYLRIRLARVVDFKDMKNTKSGMPVYIQFLDKLLGTMMRSLKLCEFGRNRAYIDMDTKSKLQCGVSVFSGYYASFNLFADGLFLKIDTCSKMIRNDNVLETINKIYQISSNSTKEEKRSIIKQQLIGKTIIASYGNIKSWKIQDIIFDVDVREYSFDNITIAQYYKQKYQIDISTPKQPLIKSFFSKRDKRQILLIPQLMFLTGMSEENQRTRRQVSTQAIKKPVDKLKSINQLIKKLQYNVDNLCFRDLEEKLKFKVSLQPEPVKATIISNPKILLGSGSFVSENRSTSFAFRGQPVFECNQINLTMVYFQGTDYGSISRTMAKLASQAAIKIKITPKSVGPFESLKSVGSIKEFLESKSVTSNRIVMIVLPKTMKSQYKHIKKASLHAKTPILTQVVLQSTINREKGLESVLTKILLQIATKTGNILWVASHPNQPQSRVCIVAIHQMGKLGNRKEVVTAYAATLTQNFQKYHTKSFISEKGQTIIINDIQKIVSDSLDAYRMHNQNTLPDELIVLRNGLTDNMDQLAAKFEAQPIKDLLQKVPKGPKLTYISIDNKPSHKFFQESKENGGGIINPPCGAIINEKVNSPNYDFFMYSAQCRMGTATPVRYKVISTNSKMEANCLESILYSQCFNYANWTGSIKYPACLQYAKKLSQFVSEQIETSLETNDLNERLYFI